MTLAITVSSMGMPCSDSVAWRSCSCWKSEAVRPGNVRSCLRRLPPPPASLVVMSTASLLQGLGGLVARRRRRGAGEGVGRHRDVGLEAREAAVAAAADGVEQLAGRARRDVLAGRDLVLLGHGEHRAPHPVD